MNGKPLTPAHGYPVRALFPGILGARSVKWLNRITVQAAESANHYQQRDYKILPPAAVDKRAAEPFWRTCPSMLDPPVNSIVGEPADGATVVRGPDGAILAPRVRAARGARRARPPRAGQRGRRAVVGRGRAGLRRAREPGHGAGPPAVALGLVSLAGARARARGRWREGRVPGGGLGGQRAARALRVEPQGRGLQRLGGGAGFDHCMIAAWWMFLREQILANMMASCFSWPRTRIRRMIGL